MCSSLAEALVAAGKNGVRERLEKQTLTERQRTKADDVADLGRGLPEIKLTRAQNAFGDEEV